MHWLLWQLFKHREPRVKTVIVDAQGNIMVDKRWYWQGIAFCNTGNGWRLQR